MNVFISWSGRISKKYAKVLNGNLPCFNHNLKCFYSPDIPCGEGYYNSIIDEANKADIIIVCLTPENIKSPWINFVVENVAFGLLSDKVKNGEEVPDYDKCREQIARNNKEIDIVYNEINRIIVLINDEKLNKTLNQFKKMQSNPDEKNNISMECLYILYLLLSQINYMITDKYISPMYYLDSLTPQLKNHRISFKEYINSIIIALGLDEKLKVD